MDVLRLVEWRLFEMYESGNVDSVLEAELWAEFERLVD
jgi:hypothetical protein